MFINHKYRKMKWEYLNDHGVHFPYSLTFGWFCTNKEFEDMINIATTYGLSKEQRKEYYERFYIL